MEALALLEKALGLDPANVLVKNNMAIMKAHLMHEDARAEQLLNEVRAAGCGVLLVGATSWSDLIESVGLCKHSDFDEYSRVGGSRVGARGKEGEKKSELHEHVPESDCRLPVRATDDGGGACGLTTAAVLGLAGRRSSWSPATLGSTATWRSWSAAAASFGEPTRRSCARCRSTRYELLSPGPVWFCILCGPRFCCDKTLGCLLVHAGRGAGDRGRRACCEGVWRVDARHQATGRWQTFLLRWTRRQM